MSAPKHPEVMLVAPVGTREVTLTDLALLPDEPLRAAWNHADPTQRVSARAKGEILLADLDRYAPALSMEIIGKAVRHVHQRHGRIDRLVLVTSDQPPSVAERYRRNDTRPLAAVVQELLKRDPKLKPVGYRTEIAVVGDNPADYEVMRAFYREGLPIWCRDLAPDGVCYLEVTGGTAQMAVMLLLEGVHWLRARAAPLYVLAEYDMPLHLDAGRQMLADELKDTLRRDLSVYAYHAAWKTAAENAGILHESLAHYDALLAVLNCARHRLNFDFAQAQAALFGAERGLPAPLRHQVMALAHELSDEGRTGEWLIAEVFHSAVVRLETESYEGFVGRVFRFQEALLRFLAGRWGAQFGGAHENVLDPEWLKAHPAVGEALAERGLSATREVTRATLQTLTLQLARERTDKQGEAWIKTLARLEQIASLRNQLVITHGFAGVSLHRLAELYKGGAPQIVADMALLLDEALARPATDSPYTKINALCLRLLEGTP
jgi:hypothetical protein